MNSNQPERERERERERGGGGRERTVEVYNPLTPKNAIQTRRENRRQRGIYDDFNLGSNITVHLQTTV